MYEKAMKRLPDNMQGKNIKAFNLAIYDELETTRDILHDVILSKSIDDAYGDTLDKYGSNVQLPRNGLHDEIYRALIKSQNKSMSSSGTINEIIEIISIILDIKPEDIKLQELWTSEIDDKEPAAFRLLNIPIRKLGDLGISAMQFLEIVERARMAGVRMEIEVEFNDSASSHSEYLGTVIQRVQNIHLISEEVDDDRIKRIKQNDMD